METHHPKHPTEILQPAERAELNVALSFALQYSGRKRVRDAEEAMAHITADRLLDHLERSGFVVMKRPPLRPHVGPPHHPFQPGDKLDP